MNEDNPYEPPQCDAPSTLEPRKRMTSVEVAVVGLISAIISLLLVPQKGSAWAPLWCFKAAFLASMCVFLLGITVAIISRLKNRTGAEGESKSDD